MPCRQLHDELGLYDPVTPSMSIRPYRPDLPDFYANGFGGSIQFTTYPCYCFLHSDDFWGTVSAHPLHQRNYTIRSIFNIQRSLILAIRNKNSIIVKLLLDHGAQTNFYLGPNFLFLLPEATRKWWVWQSLKLPPLCVAVQSKDLQLVNLLLEHGANPQIEWPSGLYRTVEHTLNMIDVLLKWPEMQSQEESLSDSILTQLRTVRSAGMFTIATAHGIECYRSMALHSVQRKAYYDLVDLLRSRGATSAQLHDVNTKFMRENIDGTLSIFIFEIFDTYFQTDNGLDEATEKAVANTASQT
ncbi:hypothetical protein N7486_001791 [Penicillium sp. IBT 16267x]|nr:hypothetical protein N7486_001791 [Penicillium sp. IBT 16267x]